MNIQIIKLRISAVLLMWLAAVGSIQAQVRVGLNAPDISWNQIDAPNYQVIFPSARQQDAFRVANMLDYILAHDSLNLRHPEVKVPIILQNQTVISNGFVTTAPFRSEFFLNPPQFQFAGVTLWVDLLTIHEYRHVQQIANGRVGFAGKLLRTLFGQSGWSFYYGAIQPNWFLEGDAVYAETVYSKGGRGRSPDFEREYRALRLSGINYNYEKASFRSFKDFVPSHYNLGYHMTTYARRNYGRNVWDSVLSEVYSKPGLYRFSKAVKKFTGLSTKELYHAAMIDLDVWWKEQDDKVNPLNDQLITDKSNKVFTSYRYPNYLSDSILVVQKSALNQIRTVYQIKDGAESRLFTPGVGLGDHYSIGGGKMVWSEIRSHPRWSNETYSVIRLFDFESGRLRKISSKSKLNAPGLSPNGKWIAAVEVTTAGEVSLVIIETSTRNEQQRAVVPVGDFVSFPRWKDDNRTVVVAGRNLTGNFLRAYDTMHKSWKDLGSSMGGTIDRIFPKGKYVYYSSSLTGIQNIFALDTSTTETFQLTNSQFGAFDPAVSPNGKKLAYSDYTANGFQIKEVLLTDALWLQPVGSVNLGSNYFQKMMATEMGDITTKVANKSYPTKPYRLFTKGLLNIHSWYPYVTTEEFGIGVLSKNLMSTMAITGQFTYNTNENSWKTLGRLSYGPFFPILDVEVSTGQRQSANMVRTTDTLSIIGYAGNWREHVFGAGVRLPLNITHGNYPSNIILSTKYKHYIVDYLDNITDLVRNENFGAVDLNFNFQRAQTKALQNIFPRWAQTLAINYQGTLGESQNEGDIFTVNTSLFFPGVVRNHSIFLTGGYQREEIVDAYRFEDLFTNARGYSSRPFERIFRISANYSLPIWFPDLAIGSLAYFKRLRGNIFYDYSEGRLLGTDTRLRSYGLELITDFRLIRLVDVGAGIRVGRKIDDSEYFVELVIANIRL